MTDQPARVPAQASPSATAAYVRIYEEEQPRLVAYARSLTRNTWAAEDLVAEAHFRVWRRLSAGHEIDNVPAYLMTTVRHLASSVASATHETPRDPQIPEQAPAGHVDDPAEQVSSTDLLVRVLGELPERWVQALWLADAEGQPLETVGRQIGAKQGATAVLLHRAREGMRQAFLRSQTEAPDDPACEVHWVRMPAYVRGNATPRQSERLLAHVDILRRVPGPPRRPDPRQRPAARARGPRVAGLRGGRRHGEVPGLAHGRVRGGGLGDRAGCWAGSSSYGPCGGPEGQGRPRLRYGGRRGHRGRPCPRRERLARDGDFAGEGAGGAGAGGTGAGDRAVRGGGGGDAGECARQVERDRDRDRTRGDGVGAVVTEDVGGTANSGDSGSGSGDSAGSGSSGSSDGGGAEGDPTAPEQPAPEVPDPGPSPVEPVPGDEEPKPPCGAGADPAGPGPTPRARSRSRRRAGAAEAGAAEAGAAEARHTGGGAPRTGAEPPNSRRPRPCW